ncbi:methyltransferase FkbM family [Chthoniobacter flavus Ellin428]|uniref:Methyltransferase FkbM family n=1 Tax=Chthoniobacter flavus Ellin428 TaxID=497964 RepID=B4D8N7_9BACT|nr:FkbM family methyltransferase [Chthoniobacter flavus]EDY17259.1 methyltransferase FkbM family [Chthoniobacter flavus Ellin428]TCO86918.1 FkbM family methyltransferase [Chthoniobacter flavus]
MHTLKRAAVELAYKLGYVVKRKSAFGDNPFLDMKQFVPGDTKPLILDIGANIGQSVTRFKATFPSCVIHSFEPSLETFRKLSQNVSNQEGVSPWNLAVGAAVGPKTFSENTHSDMSSFLELSSTGWGKIINKSTVDMVTIDKFMEDQKIPSVDILKSDTQGYDFEVFKGAEQAMKNNKIGLIYFEFIFSEMYKHLPAFDEVFRYLIDRNFVLVSIYEFAHQNRVASWSDALFVNKEYNKKSA